MKQSIVFSETMAPSGHAAATAARRRTIVPGSAAIEASSRNSVGVSFSSRSPCCSENRSGLSRNPLVVGAGAGRVRLCRAATRTSTSEMANGFGT